MVTRKAFRAYLGAHAEEQFKRCSPWSCPLAGCLSQYYDDVSVTSDAAEYRSRRTQRFNIVSMPVWAQTFVARVDNTGKPHDPITGAEALALLEA